MAAFQSEACHSREFINTNGLAKAAFTHRGRARPANVDAIAIGADILSGNMNAPL